MFLFLETWKNTPINYEIFVNLSENANHNTWYEGLGIGIILQLLTVMVAFIAIWQNKNSNNALIKQNKDSNTEIIEHQRNLERHKWIQDFREAIVGFLEASAQSEKEVNKQLKNQTDGVPVETEGILNAQVLLSSSYQKVLLCLNPREEKKDNDENELESIIYKTILHHNERIKTLENIQKIELNHNAKVILGEDNNYDTLIREISNTARNILKREWERVKGKKENDSVMEAS